MSKIIPKNVLEEIRAANNVVEVIGTYLQVKRAGSTFKALCPFHKEKTPSFNVNAQRQIFHCFGCGAGGDVFKFVMQYENVDFSTAARLLAQRAGIHVELAEDDSRGGPNKDTLYKIQDEVASSYHRALLESPSAAAAREYLKSRDLDDRAVKEFMIGYAPAGPDTILRWGQKKGYAPELLDAGGLIIKSDRPGGPGYYDRFRNRLMFAIRDELGRIIGFSGRIMEKSEKLAKYVNSPETPLFKKGRVLFALDKARRPIYDAQTAILCEGQIDCIRCHLAGFQNTVATQGTALTEEHARLLKRHADSVVLVLDADKAGQDASLRSAEILLGGGLSVSIAALPKGEDPDSLIRKQGPEAFREVVAQARSVLRFQIDVLRQREDFTKEASLMRAARAVLETIGRAPTAVQRDQLVQQAAHELKLSEDALRQDLDQLIRRRTRPSAAAAAGDPPTAPATHPPEEVALAELLVWHDDLGELVRKHVPLEQFTDPVCRMIIQHLLDRPATPGWNLSSELSGESEECQRLAAQIQMERRVIQSDDVSPLGAAQDLILVIRRKALERRRAELRKQLEPSGGKEQQRLDIECKQLTLDIKMLQLGWEKALPILEL